MSDADALRRPLPPSVFARLAQATRYAITGVSPDTWFGPLQPLAPMAPPDVKGRQFDFPFGANLNYIPRAEDGISFAELRGLADALPLLRAVIETRKDQIAAQSYAVRARARGDSPDASPNIDAVTRFLVRPDRRHSFADWVRILVEDMLVIDAATIYPRYNRGGSLYSLDIIDGATIKPLIGEDGRTPDAPDPAYQQILKGVPAADFSAEELLYLPRNVRAHKLYGMSPVEARDQSQIEIFGPRVGSVIQAHEICDEFVVGQVVAQAILQRALYVRTKFTFKLSWEYCLLDPMDVVTLTDSNLGLSNTPVRIISIEEDDKSLLTVVAEELVTGISTPQFYPGATAANNVNNYAVPAVPINTPLIYEPPPAATNGVAQVWVGASGINANSGAQWGGANVFISVDNTTYSQIAQISQPCRQGFLTANLAAATGFDTTNTLSVNLAESGGVLSGTSATAAQQGATLALVDQELLAYETATLVSGNAYNLTGLARDFGGTVGAAHSTGAPFTRLDGAIVKYDLPPSLVGVELFLKFQSFNIFGGGTQDLSTCTAYTYTPAGVGVAHPIAAQLQGGVAVDLGLTTAAVTVSDDFGQAAVSDPVVDIIDLGTAP
jgi:Putative phage tail protein